eukprot:1157455-Pelagomonas_calceolata.AAC.3
MACLSPSLRNTCINPIALSSHCPYPQLTLLQYRLEHIPQAAPLYKDGMHHLRDTASHQSVQVLWAAAWAGRTYECPAGCMPPPFPIAEGGRWAYLIWSTEELSLTSTFIRKSSSVPSRGCLSVRPGGKVQHHLHAATADSSHLCGRKVNGPLTRRISLVD